MRARADKQGAVSIGRNSKDAALFPFVTPPSLLEHIMNLHIHTIAAVALATTLASAFASGDALALTKPRSFVQNATGACQSALPVFDGQIRKRPLAVQNEGTSAAFVSCSFMDTDRSVNGVTDVYLYADNNTSSPVTVNCTLVTGISGDYPQYFPKSILLPANSKLNGFVWSSTDNGGSNFSNKAINASCQLPVGTGLTSSFVYFDEDVGA
jgi:hypothetical protein